MQKNYKFNSIEINAPDGVLENIFNIPGYNTLNLSSYKIEELPQGCFYSNKNIEKVILPDTLKIINISVFTDCRNLKDITIPNSVEEIRSNFLRSSSIYNNENNWNDNVFYKDGWAIDRRDATTINIKEGTKHISVGFANHSTFSTSDYITILTFPSTLETIGDIAFQDQEKLKEIILPKSIKKIYTDAFRGCIGLETVKLYAPNIETDNLATPFLSSGNEEIETTKIFIGKDVIKIPRYFFYGARFKNIEFEAGSKLEVFEESCFYDSYIKEITIPITTKEIKFSAFSRSSKLEKINYPGTISQWNAIKKGVLWASNIPAKYVQCSDGQVQL